VKQANLSRMILEKLCIRNKAIKIIKFSNTILINKKNKIWKKMKTKINMIKKKSKMTKKKKMCMEEIII
jgi:hypothetical protein